MQTEKESIPFGKTLQDDQNPQKPSNEDGHQCDPCDLDDSITS